MKKKVIKIIVGAVAVGGAVSLVVYLRQRKRALMFSEIRENCVKEHSSILDDQGNAPAVDTDDIVLSGEGHNCLAKKALYDLVNDEERDWDIKTLTEFVKSNCNNCKRKGSHGHNFSG